MGQLKNTKNRFSCWCVSQVSFITINCPMYSVANRGKKLSILCVSFYFINKCNNVLNIIQQYLGGGGGGAWETRSMTFDDHSTRIGELHRNKNVAFCTRRNAATLFLNIY